MLPHGSARPRQEEPYTHWIRRSFPAPFIRDALVAARLDLRELPGFEDMQTTMTCTHVMNRGGRGATSPPDA